MQRTVKAERNLASGSRGRELLELTLKQEIERRIATVQKLTAADSQIAAFEADRARALSMVHSETQASVAVAHVLVQTAVALADAAVGADTLSADFDALHAELLEQRYRVKVLTADAATKAALVVSLQEQVKEHKHHVRSRG